MHDRGLLLGMGTGRCGTRSLATLLDRQGGVRCTHEERPLLSWRHAGDAPLVKRLTRMWRTRTAPVVGDVASFYLPYVEAAIDFAPQVRIPCLRRDREEVVASFCQWLDRVHPLPTNHWAARPAPGWHHETIWTRIFPQYDLEDREAGIRRYWDEYYRRAEALARRFPANVRIFEWRDVLSTAAGQHQLLSFCGIPEERRTLALEIHENRGELAPRRSPPAPSASDRRRCAILVPYAGHIVPGCEEALRELERRGYAVRRVGGYAAIDQARNQMATDALIAGFEETLWIDADIVFDPQDVERLRAHPAPLVCGIYPKKGQQAVAVHTLPETPRLVFGKRGGLVEIKYASTGFLLVRREVYERMQYELSLPVCNERFGHPVVPFFQPTIVDDDAGPWYLAEDWAFCERARQCGYPIFADTTIRLWHVGQYRYGWEDAGEKQKRFQDYTLNLRDREDARDERTAPSVAERLLATAHPAAAPTGVAALWQAFPWPHSLPDADPLPDEAPLDARSWHVLRETLPSQPRVIVAVGSGAAAPLALAAEFSEAKLLVLAPWQSAATGHSVAATVPVALPTNLRAWQRHCWARRDRILPLPMSIDAALRSLVEHRVAPDCVYLAPLADHEVARSHLEALLSLFPRVPLLGGGWERPHWQDLLLGFASDYGLQIEVQSPRWRFTGVATGHQLIV